MAEDHTLSSYMKMLSPSGVTFDPSGKLIALNASPTYHEKKAPAETSVLVYSAEKGELMYRFAEEGKSESTPAFSPDGRRLAYLEKTSDAKFLVITELEAGTFEKIVLEGAPHQIQWNGDDLLVLMDEPEDPERKKKKEEGFDGYFFEEEPLFSSLYCYRPGSGFRKLTHKLQVWEFSASGSRIALIAADFPYESWWYHSKLYDLDAETGKATKVYDPDWRSIARPRVSPDGGKILFNESLSSDRGLSTGDILLYDCSTKKVENLTRGMDRSFSDTHWFDGSSFAALWSREGHSGISEYKNGWKVAWEAEGTVLSAFAPEFSYSGGTYAFAYTDPKSPAELYTLKAGSEPKKVSSFNEDLKDLKAYPSEIVKWKSTDDLEIYGIFRSAGKNAPLVVHIHGGPTSASVTSFMDRATLLLGEGFSVFLPNYRGSTGKGRDYAEANRGDMGGMDFTDIMTGLEFLRKSGRVDTDNIFVTGGSYGGFMTSWAVTQTDVFKAAVGLFGITDWYSFHGTSSLADWDQLHYNDDPYSGKLYRKFSPMEYVSRVKTPTLLMHGINDPFVPVSQYYQFYRALKDMGKTVRFLLFPREDHGFSEKRHMEQHHEETVKWFRKYMDQ